MDRKDIAYELENKKYMTQTEVADYFRVVPATVGVNQRCCRISEKLRKCGTF
jgi:hypothetical protein